MTTKRKLASIQCIHDITPIDGADKIELAHVLGWRCVVKKNTFHKGDIGIYFEIDSFLPVRPEFEFLRQSCYKKSDIMGEGFHLHTQKFRGQISQGLVLPVSAFPELKHLDGTFTIGLDLTDILRVRKWEIEERASTGGTIIGPLPPSVPHTDEIRIQAVPELLEAFRGKDYYISTKMDGASHSISIDEMGFHVTSHNCELRDDGKSSFYEFIKQHGYRAASERYVREHNIKTLTIQGEFCAPDIQKNRLRLKRPEWYVFTVMIDGKRVGLAEMRNVAADIGAPTVPIEEVGHDLPYVYSTVDALLSRAEGDYMNGGPKEGIVIRSTEPEYNNSISGYLSMKVINNKYLLK